MRRTWMTLAVVVALAAALLAQAGSPPAPASDWPMYRHDEAGTGYSPLRQIDAGNVAKLTRAWSYRLESDAAPQPGAGGGRGGAARILASELADPDIEKTTLVQGTPNVIVEDE